MQDGGQLRTAVRGGNPQVLHSEVEVRGIPEADDDRALAVLGDEALGIDDPLVDRVLEFVLQGVLDDLEGAALVVPEQVLDVLEDEGPRPVVGEDPGDVEEERALGAAEEAVRAAEGVLLGHAGDEKGWQGKPASSTSCDGISSSGIWVMSPATSWSDSKLAS